MATEKILIFDEAGNAKRMKVRIARFLDNEPVTATDKENIRTTLDVDGSQSGTFTTPLSVTSASDSSFTGGGDLNVSGGVTTLTNSGDNALRVESTNGNPMTVNVVGAAQNYIFDVRDDGTSKFRVDGSGRVGVGQTAMGSYNSNANNLVVGSGSGSEGLTISSGTTGEGGIYFADGTTGNQQYRGYLGYGHTNDELFFGTDGVTKWKLNSTGNLVPQSSGLGIDFGSVAGGSGTPATNGGLLADYEFGTFTVTAGGTWTSAPTSMGGRYVKVGNLVTCWVAFAGSPTKSSSLAGWLEGLPFSTNSYDGQGSVSDTGVTDRGVCYAANTNRLWLTNTSFGVTNIATVSYRHD